mmetsp:Transcript_10216/g.37966  ORF Transcript_10216/g.37966 Transcript_10216/m.37966 type:complete len:94 (+) Transcript_10216:295-576(+)
MRTANCGERCSGLHALKTNASFSSNRFSFHHLFSSEGSMDFILLDSLEQHGCIGGYMGTDHLEAMATQFLATSPPFTTSIASPPSTTLDPVTN